MEETQDVSHGCQKASLLPKLQPHPPNLEGYVTSHLQLAPETTPRPMRKVQEGSTKRSRLLLVHKEPLVLPDIANVIHLLVMLETLRTLMVLVDPGD